MIALLHTRIKFEKSETPTTRMAGYLNNGMSRLDTQSRIAPIV
jgi:hypothetical protein